MKLIDYHTGAVVATFNGTNPRNDQLCAWLTENGYLVHRQRGCRLYVIK